jgi:hypothetical protein
VSQEKIMSGSYHLAHLGLMRSEIIDSARREQPLLDLLKTYTEDVVKAERDRVAVEHETMVERVAKWGYDQWRTPQSRGWDGFSGKESFRDSARRAIEGGK